LFGKSIKQKSNRNNLFQYSGVEDVETSKNNDQNLNIDCSNSMTPKLKKQKTVQSVSEISESNDYLISPDEIMLRFNKIAATYNISNDDWKFQSSFNNCSTLEFLSNIIIVFCRSFREG
jgi:hypothetical protein